MIQRVCVAFSVSDFAFLLNIPLQIHDSEDNTTSAVVKQIETDRRVKVFITLQ